MAAGLLDRALGMVELLASHAGGLPLQGIAAALDIPKSATHRMLGDLIRLGYVRQGAVDGSYALTTKLVSLGFRYLADSGLLDIAQPILDRLAAETGELVGLAVVDGDRLSWVAKSQGAKSGLRFDLNMGEDAPLSSSASGQAWLASLSDEDAFELVARQGLAQAPGVGPGAPRTIADLLACLDLTRERGYAVAVDTYAVGVAALAVAVRDAAEGAVIGVVSVSGPGARLDDGRLAEIAPAVRRAAAELAVIGPGTRHRRG